MTPREGHVKFLGYQANASARAGIPHNHIDYHLRYIWLESLVAALGGLLFRYDWVVIGGAKPFFERYFGLTGELVRGWANSCALLGCLVGSLMAGFFFIFARLPETKGKTLEEIEKNQELFAFFE